MNEKFKALLGFAVKAGRVSFGHDAVKQCIRLKRAKLLLFTRDASPRLREELTGLAGNVPAIDLAESADELAAVLGRRAAALAVGDEGFAQSLLKHVETTVTQEDKLWQQ